MNYGKVDFLLTDEWNRSHDLATAVAKDGVVYLGTKEAGIIGRYEKIDFRQIVFIASRHRTLSRTRRAYDYRRRNKGQPHK